MPAVIDTMRAVILPAQVEEACILELNTSAPALADCRVAEILNAFIYLTNCINEAKLQILTSH